MSGMFWALAGVLMALVLGILCWPLLGRKSATQAASRQAINTAIYRDQLAELARERDSGALAPDDYLKSREELERRVLEDTVADDGQPEDAPARRVPRTALALLVTLPLLAVPLYLVLGTPAGLDPLATAATTGSEHGDITPEKIQQMVRTLEARLEKSPDNPEGWVMLARAYKATGRFDEAEKAYGKAGPVAESEPTVMLERVDLDLQKNRGQLSGKGKELLGKVLQKEPESPMALVYAGMDAYFRMDYKKAIGYWERLQKQVKPDSDDGRNLARGIARTKELMAKNDGKPPQVLPWEEAARAEAPAAPAAEKPAAAPGQASGASISGRVELDGSVKGKAAPGDTVYIFARAVEGSRMPLAVVKAKVSDLPLAFTLDDSMAMSPDLKLSGFPEVKIEVRVSKAGDVMAKPGDLSGLSAPLKLGAKDVTVKIDKVVP